MASGGMVDRPTLALLGEGGEREYVIPESKMRGGVQLGGIHLNVAGLSAEEAAALAANEVRRALLQLPYSGRLGAAVKRAYDSQR